MPRTYEVEFIDRRQVPHPKRDWKSILNHMLDTGKAARIKIANRKEGAALQASAIASMRRYLPAGYMVRTRRDADYLVLVVDKGSERSRLKKP